MSDLSAERAARTFLALLNLADEDTLYEVSRIPAAPKEVAEPQTAVLPEPRAAPTAPLTATVGLHYNIQIHLPATKDIEIYNAIFKSLRGHLID
jgi:hypothetical protein